MEPPWDQVYARDVPPDFDEMRKREDRKERIKPHWDLLVTDKEPKVNKDTLIRLMHDLKEEGNTLFKESLYDIAWMHYRNAIFVVRILENRFYHVVEKEFTSSLFSNRAFCCLKKNMYKEAAQDCESAIGLYSKNIKAYYRQALAYKHLKKYEEAHKAACKGQEIQPSSALKELIDELEALLKPCDKAPGSNLRRSTEVSAKSSAAISIQSTTPPQPDDDWLTGTNITVTEKHLEQKSKMPSKKSKKKNRGSSSQSKMSNDMYLDEDEESDDMNSSLGAEDDKEFATMLKGVQANTMLNGRNLGGGLDIVAPKVEDNSAWEFPHDSEEDVIEKSTTITKVTVPTDNMGLDTFSAVEYPLAESESASYTNSNTSSGRSSRASQSPTKFTTVTSKRSSSSPSPSQEIIPQITFPFMNDFDFKLACRNCFAKIGEGVKGFRYVSVTHNCLRDTLILKKKNVPGMSWVKVRFRPDSKAIHHGTFKICTQFGQGKPCKVGEEKCTFPHHQAEMKLWTIDRDGKFSIEDFVTKCRTYNINDSESLELQQSKPQYIPGLNFAGSKTKKQTLETVQLDTSCIVDPPIKQQQMPTGPVSRQANQVPKPNISQAVPQNRYVPPQSGLLGHAPHHGPQIGPYSTNRLSTSFAPGSFSQPPPAYTNQSQWSREKPTVFHDTEIPAVPEQVAKLENPMSSTHIAMIVCQYCFKPTTYPGIYNYQQVTHKCEETILAMRIKDGSGPWMRVRERKNHRDFPGNYILCRCITFKNPIFCKYGEDGCSFAHNDIEKYFWKLEKDGKFDITEFLMQNRKVSETKGFSLKEILAKHGGYFEFVCRSCYYGTPPRISLESPNDCTCSGQPPHSWKDFSIMAHMGPSGVTLVNPRGFLHKTAFFKICKWLQFCRNRVNAECRFAHSLIERDMWMLERDCGLPRPELIKESKQMQGIPQLSPISAANQAGPVKSTSFSSVADVKSVVQVSDSGDFLKPSDDLCPLVVAEVCETCWKKGQKTLQAPGKDRCQKSHANWSRNIVYIISPSNKELRPLPRKIPAGFNFIICVHVREGRKCGFTGAGPCQFAHSTEEMEAWKYMCLNNMKTQQQLSEASKAAQKLRSESAKSKISGMPVVSVSHSSIGNVRPTLPVANIHTYYCHYCGCSCNSQKQWDEHCASEKHTFNMNSDKEHQWNYRQPPWTAGRSYELCAKHFDGHKCQYSSVPEMYNLCRCAHSSEELDEWKERYEWRQMKREVARQEKVFSYMDQLLEKYENSQSSVKVICEEVDGVDIKTTGDLNIYKEEKDATNIWTFDVKSKKRLEKVALLYNRDRLHFSLISGSEKSCQIVQGEMFATDIDHMGMPYYRVQLKFTGGMFGSFQQWILFDFGSEPVPCRKITVEVGDQSSHEKVRNLREQLHFDRWTSLNREIVRHELDDELEEALVTKYKEPSSSETVITRTTVVTELNRHNYVPKMHKLLELEEMTRHHVISEYNLCTTIECLNAIQEDTFVYAKPGELFARVPLQENLTEDTDAGKLILTSVRKVLLASQNDSTKIVYEASIVREENFNYDGRGREFIYLCLSPECVKRLGLMPGKNIGVEIQFQMNRLSFCRMHYAIDRLKATDIVFPDVPKINPLRNEKHNLRITSQILNPDQMSAVRHIVAERTGYTPPFVLFGPFGTGKTETIAQATMVLMKETKDTRILICAQSNSAADLYIVKHLDTFLKKTNSTEKLRRVYFKERRVYTVAPEVKKYCLLSPDGDQFDMPTREDIEKHRVVIVTVTTSLLLTSMGLQGLFTHIFIDEAAQTLECETLMPLSLATERTCVVLAGDHKQISPKVYSEEACNQKFHQSLLERLYNYYDSHSSLINESSPLNILLSINYRTKMEILRFISAVFYGGPDVLKSEANIRSVVDITPLVFYAVQGREVQDDNSISYYNMSEVQEIVERVDYLYEKWPEEWGTRSAKEIGVVTPYYDQVLLIRKALKKRNMALRDVMVERVQGVQGKEFRAMFITTVRTRHLIEASHVQNGALTECDGEGGDFGFLSDSKLLNTALTRAQSLVVVVGDPVALCAIGECVNVWRTYLKHCQNMSSLYPQNHNFESIRQQVQNLLNSPARERLLEIANERQTKKKRQTQLSAIDKDSNNGNKSLQVYSTAAAAICGVDAIPNVLNPITEMNGFQKGIVNHSQNGSIGLSFNGTPPRSPLTPFSSLGMGIKRGGTPAPLTLLQQRKIETFFEVGEDFTLDPDDVIQTLAKQVSKEGIAGKATISLGAGLNGNIDKNLIQLTEESGHAVLYYDSGIKSVEAVTQSAIGLDESQLKTLLSSNPGKYIQCIIHVDSKSCYADVLDVNSTCTIKQIEIPSRWMCGQANNNDEVVVELFNNGSPIFGKVVGVLKTATELRERCIICSVRDESGVMYPVDEGLSPMFNITTAANLEKSIEGEVSIYKFTKNKQIRFSHMWKLEPADMNNSLLAVRFLKWDSALTLPLCVVVGVIPCGGDLSSGMRVLDLNHHVQKSQDTSLLEEVELMYPADYQVSKTMFNSRHMDLRETWCFTIDSTMAEDINRAFSIDEVGDGSYLVGVHVADISSFVEKDSNLDIFASSRGQSLHPVNADSVHMLPSRLSTQICSLKPHEDKLAISVLMTVQPTGLITQVNVQKTVINCKKRYTHREAEEVLHDPSAHEDYLKSCVLVLFEISRIWRKERLGTAAGYQENINSKLSPFTRQLVQELVIKTEFHIAQIVVNKFPHATPLCVQQPPDDVVLNLWRQEHAADAVNSIALTKPFLDTATLETCNCGLACTHTVNYVRQCNIQKRDHIDVISAQWDKLSDAIGDGDFNFIQKVIVTAENHPQLAIAIQKLRLIQKTPQLICSSDAIKGRRSHYTINHEPYTSFTQPLSSFSDIVVQRLLLACLDNKPCPYTQTEIQCLCTKLNKSFIKSRQYEDNVQLLQLSSTLLTRPLLLLPVIQQVNLDSVQMCFPTLPSIVSQQQPSIDLGLLGASEKMVSTDSGSVLLKWQERVYDLAILRSPASVGNNYGELNPYRFIYKIPAMQWQRLLIAIREPNEENREKKLYQAVEIVRKQVSNPALDSNYIEEITSEVQKMGKMKHFTDFCLKMYCSQVIRVQLSASMDNGILSPFIQLINITPRLDVCLQHRKHPVKCFTPDLISIASDCTDPALCLDVSTYQKVWTRIVDLESAHKAVASNERILIHNVQMIWSAEPGTNKVLTAQFSLPLTFMKERQIKVKSDLHLKELFSPANSTYCSAYFSDFMCIRYSNLNLPDDPGLSEGLAMMVNNGAPVTWVGHGIVTAANLDNDGVTMKIQLVQSDVPLPVTLIQRQACTVEIIQRTEADRNMLTALKSLEESCQLTKDIVMRKTPVNNVNSDDVELLQQLGRSIIYVPNQQQEDALVQALKQPFTVIQGSVGTGKTVLAVKLGYMYTQRNRPVRGISKPQVLVCAPTESSLDVLTGYFLSLNNSCPMVVRVYSTEIERTIHPNPKDVIRPTSGETGVVPDPVKDNYSSISLYNLVRSSETPFGKSLKEFDTLFSLYPDDISDDQFDEYQQLVNVAESSVLKEAEIILCTCVTSGMLKLSSATNIQQIIIDDTNACTEPEVLVPLSTYKDVKQVVLIGDVNQLGPAVFNQTARDVGLGKSMMKTYSDSAISLTVHYRVHEGIIDFPSKYSYGGRLMTGNMVQRQPSVINWPGGRDKPSAFCHLDGVEGRLSIGTGYSNDETVDNGPQADFAVKVASSFVTRYQAVPNNVAIISATKAQSVSIKKKLNFTGQNISSLTMLESQGKEFDYVILTTVRTMPKLSIEVRPSVPWKKSHLGNLMDHQLVTVALTRSRKGLVILGNQALLRCDDMWNKLLNDYDQGKKLLSADNFLQTMSM